MNAATPPLNGTRATPVTRPGAPLAQGKRVTGLTNGEEEMAVHLTKLVPFFVEDELMALGTGQNPRIIDQRRPSVSKATLRSLVRSTNANVRHRHPLWRPS